MLAPLAPIALNNMSDANFSIMCRGLENISNAIRHRYQNDDAVFASAYKDVGLSHGVTRNAASWAYEG